MWPIIIIKVSYIYYCLDLRNNHCYFPSVTCRCTLNKLHYNIWLGLRNLCFISRPLVASSVLPFGFLQEPWLWSLWSVGLPVSDMWALQESPTCLWYMELHRNEGNGSYLSYTKTLLRFILYIIHADHREFKQCSALCCLNSEDMWIIFS